MLQEKGEKKQFLKKGMRRIKNHSSQPISFYSATRPNLPPPKQSIEALLFLSSLFCTAAHDMGTKEEVKPNFRTPPR
jgi:hypothetical protein